MNPAVMGANEVGDICPDCALIPVGRDGRGGALCPFHAATPRLLIACRALADRADATSECDHARLSCEEIGCIGFEVKRARAAIAKAEGRHAPSLSAVAVKKIKRLFRVGFTDKEISRQFEIHASTVRQIRKGEIYRSPGEQMNWPPPVRSRQA